MIDLLKSWLFIVGAVIAGIFVVVGVIALLVWAWSNLPFLGALIVTVITVGMVVGTLIWSVEEFS